MSENTNKIFWITALGLVVTAVCILLFWSVTKPTRNLYDNNNNISLCDSSSRADSLICLDASSNSKQGLHVNNEGSNKNIWFSQANLEETDNSQANLSNFNYDSKSGWLDYALLFDGNDDKVSLNLKNASFADGVTIQLNVKPLETNKNTPLISNGNLSINIEDNHFVFKVKTDNEYKVISNKTIVAGDWYLIQATYNNDRMKIYVNGILENDLEISGTIPTISNDFIISPGIKAEVSSIMIYNKDVELTGINQNTEAIYRKVYTIDAYRENFSPSSEGCTLWTVPMTGEYQVELWGAQGGHYGTGSAGKGAYTSGELVLNKGDEYYVCVGKQGSASSTLAKGGEATDFRLDFNGNKNDFNSLKSRIMVAAAGGGSINANGGAGGALTGLTSKSSVTDIKNAKGGTQTEGGIKATRYVSATGTAANAYITGTNGSFAIGGSASTGATGGDGYYGGGAISKSGGAAGGSSYISGHLGVNSIEASSTASRITHNGSVSHYSKVTFFSTRMINGEGLMPSSNHIDETYYGHPGDGHARITYISGNQTDFKPEEQILKPGKSSILDYKVSSSTITANFEAVDNASSYACYYGESEDSITKIGTVTTTINGEKQCNISGLDENKDYYVRMDAINGEQKTSADIVKIHTDYKTPLEPEEIDKSSATYSIQGVWSPSQNATRYTCSVGTSPVDLDMAGVVTIEDDKIICDKDSLIQDTVYYFKLTAINGDKQTSSVIDNIRTTYAVPGKTTFVNDIRTDAEITTNWTGVNDATSYVCKYGTDENNLDGTGEVLLDGERNPRCYIKDLNQGTHYFIQVTAINGDKSEASDIIDIRTNYIIPGKSAELSNSVTNDSITTTFAAVDQGKTYTCYYSDNKENITNRVGAIRQVDGNYQCNFSGLEQNTEYFYYVEVTNGDETVKSDIFSSTTLYNDATVSTFLDDEVGEINLITRWKVTNLDEDYLCELSHDGETPATVNKAAIEGDIATCSFEQVLSDSDYYTRVKSINGDKTAEAEWHKNSLDLILPNITASIPSTTMNSNNWAKTDFDVTLSITSQDPMSIYAIAWCKGTEKCTPSYSIDTIETEEDGETIEKLVFNAQNSSNGGEIHQGSPFTHDVRISAESPTNYVCAQAITVHNKVTDVKCFGPYALDKTKPTINYTETLSTTQFTSLAMYKDFTTTDNLTGASDLVKVYSSTPDWDTPDTYTVNYTVTDLAGNSRTVTRKFIVNWYEVTFNVDTIVNGTTQTSGKSGFTFDIKIEHVTGNTTKTGVIDWSGKVKYGSKITVTAKEKTGYTLTNGTITKTSGTSDITVSPNWQRIVYNITYDLNGGSGVSNRTYTIEDNFTLPTPTPPTGYNFSGWTGSNGTTPQTSVTLNGAYGDKSYKANYVLKSYTVDVNPVIDNTTYNAGRSGWTFNVYIDGTLVAQNVTDWAQAVNHFSTVRVVANGKSCYRISANADVTKTITGATNFNPTWLDNAAPSIDSIWYQDVVNDPRAPSVQKNYNLYASVSDCGSGVGNVRYELLSNGSWIGQTYAYSSRHYEDFLHVINGWRSHRVQAWDNVGNYSVKEYGFSL